LERPQGVSAVEWEKFDHMLRRQKQRQRAWAISDASVGMLWAESVVEWEKFTHILRKQKSQSQEENQPASFRVSNETRAAGCT
jgi:hypothetical protein